MTLLDTPAEVATPEPTRRPLLRALAWLGVGAVAVAVVVAVAVPPSVLDPSGLDGTVLAEFPLDRDVTLSAGPGTQVQVLRLSVSPGTWMGWHEHDGTEFVAVAAGRAESWLVDGDRCIMQQYGVGAGIVESPHHVHNIHNPGPAPLVLVVTSVTPEHHHISRDEPRPPGCPAGGST